MNDFLAHLTGRPVRVRVDDRSIAYYDGSLVAVESRGSVTYLVLDCAGQQVAVNFARVVTIEQTRESR